MGAQEYSSHKDHNWRPYCNRLGGGTMQSNLYEARAHWAPKLIRLRNCGYNSNGHSWKAEDLAEFECWASKAVKPAT